jgi:predicted secreted Zn-dependent protease
MRSVLRKVISLGVAAITPLIVVGPDSLTEEDVQLKFTMDYYNVSGETWPDILNSIKTSLQREEDLQGRFEGITHYDVKLTPDDLVENNTCSSSTAVVAVNLVVKVPRLTTRKLKQGQDCWAYYDRSLTDHEEWHVQIAMHDMRALQAKIRSSPNMSCREIVQLVKQDFQKMIDEQNNYDAITSHGLYQWKAYGLDAPKDYEKKFINDCFG